jgi:hypothetical protein
MMFTIEHARKLLTDAQVFFDPDEEEPNLAQTLNMNDVWCWACAYGETVLGKRTTWRNGIRIP